MIWMNNVNQQIQFSAWIDDNGALVSMKISEISYIRGRVFLRFFAEKFCRVSIISSSRMSSARIYNHKNLVYARRWNLHSYKNDEIRWMAKIWRKVCYSLLIWYRRKSSFNASLIHFAFHTFPTLSFCRLSGNTLNENWIWKLHASHNEASNGVVKWLFPTSTSLDSLFCYFSFIFAGYCVLLILCLSEREIYIVYHSSIDHERNVERERLMTFWAFRECLNFARRKKRKKLWTKMKDKSAWLMLISI